MSCKTETTTIGDHEYSVTQWPATKAVLMKLKLVKLFGATLARVAGGIPDTKTKSKQSNSEKEAIALSEGLTTLFAENSPEEIMLFIKESIVGIGCDGVKITGSTFDEIFSGDSLMEIYQVFLFVLRVNYSNLMKGQLVESLLAKMKDRL